MFAELIAGSESMRLTVGVSLDLLGLSSAEVTAKQEFSAHDVLFYSFTKCQCLFFEVTSFLLLHFGLQFNLSFFIFIHPTLGKHTYAVHREPIKIMHVN